MIPVTKPFLPPISDYYDVIKEIWDYNWLTNNGPKVQKLENELNKYLQVNNLKFVSNGTIALQIAIKALDLKGEVITTPFSYVATTSSIVWEGCKPIFVDIDLDTLNIDPSLIEQAITPDTSGILATHVFGNPCAIEAIQEIADRNNLKVIYDAAHCFGTKYKGESVYNYGDISIASFHATKLFHSVEGGALITNREATSERIEYMRNFGHDGFGKFNGVGINAKNSELHAGVGLLNLKYIDEVLAKRKYQFRIYDACFNSCDIKKPIPELHAEPNNSYYPIIFKNESQTLLVKAVLEKELIYTRRYFYPSLNKLGYVNDINCPVSEQIAKSILCLPLYHDLEKKEQVHIANLIKKSLRK